MLLIFILITGHAGVVGKYAGQPSKYESEGREFESPNAPRFMSNMLAPSDLLICLCNGVQLKFVWLGINRIHVSFTSALKLSHLLLTQIDNHNKVVWVYKSYNVCEGITYLVLKTWSLSIYNDIYRSISYQTANTSCFAHYRFQWLNDESEWQIQIENDIWVTEWIFLRYTGFITYIC